MIPKYDVDKIRDLDAEEIILPWDDFFDLACNVQMGFVHHDSVSAYMLFIFKSGTTIVRPEKPLIGHSWKQRNLCTGLMVSNAHA